MQVSEHEVSQVQKPATGARMRVRFAFCSLKNIETSFCCCLILISYLLAWENNSISIEL